MKKKYELVTVDAEMNVPMKYNKYCMKITHINPDGLHKNPAFSQAVFVTGRLKPATPGRFKSGHFQ